MRASSFCDEEAERARSEEAKRTADQILTLTLDLAESTKENARLRQENHSLRTQVLRSRAAAEATSVPLAVSHSVPDVRHDRPVETRVSEPDRVEVPKEGFEPTLSRHDVATAASSASGKRKPREVPELRNCAVRQLAESIANSRATRSAETTQEVSRAAA